MWERGGEGKRERERGEEREKERLYLSHHTGYKDPAIQKNSYIITSRRVHIRYMSLLPHSPPPSTVYPYHRVPLLDLTKLNELDCDMEPIVSRAVCVC